MRICSCRTFLFFSRLTALLHWRACKLFHPQHSSQRESLYISWHTCMPTCMYAIFLTCLCSFILEARAFSALTGILEVRTSLGGSDSARLCWWLGGKKESQSSESNLQLSPDTLALDNMAHLEVSVFEGPMGSEFFGAGEQQSRLWAGPVLSGNTPIISRLLHSTEQTESAVGFDWRR